MSFPFFQSLRQLSPVLRSSAEFEQGDRRQGNTIPANTGRLAELCAAFSVNTPVSSNVKVWSLRSLVQIDNTLSWRMALKGNMQRSRKVGQPRHLSSMAGKDVTTNPHEEG